ncbi:MAG TPA: hypothetical protein VK590_06180 [Saprospiraceae bacterium]|nr:hypothetical protein [Saprospiraceae bacterium]
MINTLLLIGFLLVSIFLEIRFIGKSRVSTPPEPTQRIPFYELAEAPYNSLNSE